MAHPDVVDTVTSFLRDNWTGAPWEGPNGGMAQTSGTGEPFFVVQFPFSTSERISTGTEFYREDGGIRFVVHVPRNTGYEAAEAIFRELHALFLDRRIGDVRCGVPDSPFFDDSNDEGLYHQSAMVVPYWFTFTR